VAAQAATLATDLTTSKRHNTDATSMPAEPAASTVKASVNGGAPTTFSPGEAEGIGWMTPAPAASYKRTPAKQLVNVVMQLPADVTLDARPQRPPST